MEIICLIYCQAKLVAQNLKIVAVCIVEGVESVAINVEYCTYRSMSYEWNNNLGT